MKILDDTSSAAVVLKAAKRSLKKEESGELKMKELVKRVAKKLQGGGGDNKAGANTTDSKQIQAWIEQSSKFRVENKKVSLKRKRSASPKSSSSDEGADQSKDAKNKRKKTAKAGQGRGGAEAVVARWRDENKVILMHSTDDEKGQAITKVINQKEAYYPFTTFDDAGSRLAPTLIRQCTEGNGFVKPSPIQAQAWPVLTAPTTNCGNNKMKGRDIVGIAETGSGKTLALALPALSQMAEADNKSKTNGRRRLPRMLVLAPTRELAMQSDAVLKEFGAVVRLKSLVVYGGVPKYTQTNELKKGNVDCVVATPGRLKDLIQEGSCDLSAIEHLVLDEADKLCDLGFEEDVRFIISSCKPKEHGRQTSMFSATWPATIQNIAMEYMIDPVRIYVGFESITAVGNDANKDGSASMSAPVDDSLSANKRVKQIVEVMDDRQREARLREVLNQVHGGRQRKNRVLVFALYKKEAERLEHSLRRSGWNCCSLHGNKTQQARTAALAQFKDGSCPLMIATDCAARGLDIPNVEAVINFTFPLTIEDYVHRIGRTGRAGKTGTSYTFFQPGDKARAGELQQVMRQANQPIPDELMKFGSTIKRKEHKLYGNFGPRGNGGAPMKQSTKITFNHSDDEED